MEEGCDSGLEAQVERQPGRMVGRVRSFVSTRPRCDLLDGFAVHAAIAAL